MQQNSADNELKRKVKKAVEKVFRDYRLYKYLGFERREATLTASYDERTGGNTGITSDQTAKIAIYNVDTPEERKKFCERVEEAVEGLPAKEKFLVKERYMRLDYKGEYIKDRIVYELIFQPPISFKHFDDIRWRALIWLTLKLDLKIDKE